MRIRSLSNIGSEKERKHQPSLGKIMPRGNNSDNAVKIMHTSAPTSSFGDGASMSSTVRSCGSGMEGHQQPVFQPSANPVLAETFERHWQQLRGIAAHNTTVPTPDDVVAVSNLLDQMTSLLEMEQTMLEELQLHEDANSNDRENIQLNAFQENEASDRRASGSAWHILPGTTVMSPSQNQRPFFLPHQDSSEPSSMSNTPCLDILLSENILAHILAASRMPVAPEHADQMRLQQLKLYETLLGGSAERARQLLSHQPFLRPLLDLLNQFSAAKADSSNSSQHYSPIYYSEDHVINRTKYGELGLRTNDHHFSDGSKRSLPFLKEESHSEELSISYQTETHLVSLLNQLCSRLMEKDNAKLLDVFFHASQNLSSNDETTAPVAEDNEKSSNENNSQFPIFTILVGFLHFDGNVGQQARDALLLCMTLSKRHNEVGKHIARNTNFCPLLATGLSGLYSLLPRRLPKEPVDRFYGENWHRITQEDLSHNRLGTEMDNFLSSLEFCDAVIQVAHPSIRQHLLGLIYMGFLVPVLGPALTQSLEAELICSTAYVDLFIRRITEPSLLAVFLRFIFTDVCDEKNIIDTLTARLGLQSQLCTVTLSLFETLVGLNCEDVMLWLVFRHLIPMEHLIPNQRPNIKQPDLHGRAAERLLSMTPICCLEASANSSQAANTSIQLGASNASYTSRTSAPNNVNQSHQNQVPHPVVPTPHISLPTFLVGWGGPTVEEGVAVSNNNASSSSDIIASELSNYGNSSEYHSYLLDARNAVRQRFEATNCWLYDYDGIYPPPNSTASANSLRASDDDVIDNDSTKNVKIHHEVKDKKSRVYESKGSLVGEEKKSEFSSTFGLTAEETREFWDMLLPTETGSDAITTFNLGEDNEEVVMGTDIANSPMKDEIISGSPDFRSLPINVNTGIKSSTRFKSLGAIHSITGDAGTKFYSSDSDPSGNAIENTEIDVNIHSLGPFLDLLFEKIELMPTNNLATNLLVTGVISQLASYPQPLLRSVLLHPDLILQPSIRGLFTAIASLRQKVDNIMPTLPGAEQGVRSARKFLSERLVNPRLSSKDSRKVSNVSLVSSTITQIGQEAINTRKTISAAFSSMFGMRKSRGMTPAPALSNNLPSQQNIHSNQNTSSPVNTNRSTSNPKSLELHGSNSEILMMDREVRQYALAAVILEEWLHELAAIAQEQSVLQKERLCQINMAISEHKDD